MLRNLKLCGVVSAFDNWVVPRSKRPATGSANTMNYFVHKNFSTPLVGGGGGGISQEGGGLNWPQIKKNETCVIP